MLARLIRFARSNAIALAALFFALAGTGLAASRYLITSTSQIKPSVLRELRGAPAAGAAALSKNGVHAVVAKARNTSAVEARPEGVIVPMSGGTWTQHPEEDELVVGQVTIHRLTSSECGSPEHPITPEVGLTVLIPDHPVYGALGSVNIDATEVVEGPETYTIRWDEERHSTLPLLAPRTATTHTFSVLAYSPCTGRRPAISEIALDVLGFH